MIRIELSDDDLSRTRLALSPLWELVGSLFLLHDATPEPEHAPWVAQAREAVRGMDLGPLTLDGGARRRCPDFMAPVPTEPLADVDAGLERLRTTDPAVVRRDVAECWPDGPPAAWEPFLADPRTMVDRLADHMRAYWTAALADDWPRVRAVLEGEMLGRARSLALAGPAAVLDELHPNARWRPPVIELHKKGKHHELSLAGRPLILVPMVFVTSFLIGCPDEEAAVALGYKSRGIAGLWEPEDPGADGRLELLLGHGRAAVLRALERPATTTELARRLSYAPSTVSAHLDVLARGGLVERHRVQRRVYYSLNDTGSSLVALLAEIPAALTA